MKEKLGPYVLGALILLMIICAGALLINQCQKTQSVMEKIK